MTDLKENKHVKQGKIPSDRASRHSPPSGTDKHLGGGTESRVASGTADSRCGRKKKSHSKLKPKWKKPNGWTGLRSVTYGDLDDWTIDNWNWVLTNCEYRNDLHVDLVKRISAGQFKKEEWNSSIELDDNLQTWLDNTWEEEEDSYHSMKNDPNYAWKVNLSPKVSPTSPTWSENMAEHLKQSKDSTEKDLKHFENLSLSQSSGSASSASASCSSVVASFGSPVEEVFIPSENPSQSGAYVVITSSPTKVVDDLSQTLKETKLSDGKEVKGDVKVDRKIDIDALPNEEVPKLKEQSFDVRRWYPTRERPVPQRQKLPTQAKILADVVRRTISSQPGYFCYSCHVKLKAGVIYCKCKLPFCHHCYDRGDHKDCSGWSWHIDGKTIDLKDSDRRPVKAQPDRVFNPIIPITSANLPLNQLATVIAEQKDGKLKSSPLNLQDVDSKQVTSNETMSSHVQLQGLGLLSSSVTDSSREPPASYMLVQDASEDPRSFLLNNGGNLNFEYTHSTKFFDYDYSFQVVKVYPKNENDMRVLTVRSVPLTVKDPCLVDFRVIIKQKLRMNILAKLFLFSPLLFAKRYYLYLAALIIPFPNLPIPFKTQDITLQVSAEHYLTLLSRALPRSNEAESSVFSRIDMLSGSLPVVNMPRTMPIVEYNGGIVAKHYSRFVNSRKELIFQQARQISDVFNLGLTSPTSTSRLSGLLRNRPSLSYLLLGILCVGVWQQRRSIVTFMVRRLIILIAPILIIIRRALPHEWLAQQRRLRQIRLIASEHSRLSGLDRTLLH